MSSFFVQALPVVASLSSLQLLLSAITHWFTTSSFLTCCPHSLWKFLFLVHFFTLTFKFLPQQNLEGFLLFQFCPSIIQCAGGTRASFVFEKGCLNPEKIAVLLGAKESLSSLLMVIPAIVHQSLRQSSSARAQLMQFKADLRSLYLGKVVFIARTSTNKLLLS